MVLGFGVTSSGKIVSYRDLRVWQEAMSVAEQVYELSTRLPKDELYGLTSQMRRAAVSVPANVAEGYGRGGGHYKAFLRVAQGSLKELETHLLLAERVRLIEPGGTASILERTDGLGRMLNRLISSLGSE